MAQVVECLPSKLKAQSQSSNTSKAKGVQFLVSFIFFFLYQMIFPDILLSVSWKIFSGEKYILPSGTILFVLSSVRM
jgi:hypothetical protein